MGENSSNKNFAIDPKEKFIRSWWLAHKVTNAILSDHFPGSWFDDVRHAERLRRILAETACYTMSAVLNRILDEIKRHHGWTNDTFNLNISYLVSLGSAFDQVFNIQQGDPETFIDLLNQYYDPKFKDDYDIFWDISSDVTEEDMMPDILKDYNAVKYYVYRISKIVKIIDREKVLHNAEMFYAKIGLSFYDRAFFELPSEVVKKELQGMVNR